MIHLRSVTFPQPKREPGAYPFSLPIVQSLAGSELCFTSEISFLIGENGSGKSTLLEALACAIDSIPVGSLALSKDPSLDSVRRLSSSLSLTWRKRTRSGFFLRAEDFFGYAKQLRQTREDLRRELDELDLAYRDRSPTARTMVGAPYRRELSAADNLYGQDINSCSHGESFLSLFQSRLAPDGLYLLDEPEAALSPSRQLALLAMIHGAAKTANAQFIVSTHSPILMALPEATLLSCDDGKLRTVAYDDVPNVSLTRDFLNSPQAYLHHLLREP